MEENKINALVNVGQSKVVEKAYDDIASPLAKKLGEALSTIIDISNTFLWPIKFGNEKTKLYFENNINKYKKKLENIDGDKVVNVPTEISKPILERFTYLSNEDLSNAFVLLLSNASSSDTINLAHPGFISVIDRLSPDEAKVLKYLKDVESIPKLDITYSNSADNSYVFVIQNATGIEKKVSLTFPENINLYLDNLESLGIIKSVTYYHIELEAELKKIETDSAELFNEHNKEGLSASDHESRKRIEKGMYVVSSYGDLFLKACIDNNQA
ncbi:MAG: DUF4393 domain-containing protein [Bacteroidota bacterium]